MKKIKLSINSPKEGLLRQTPNNDGIWGDYKFYINEEIEECDFWVVYSKGENGHTSTRVAPENIILLTGEPEPIYHYASSFVKKFGIILTSRNDIVHNNIIKTHPAQPWWVGRKMKNDGTIEFNLGFEDFLNEEPLNKKKMISVITSNKSFTRGHKERIRFVNNLKDHFGDSLDVFGKGINGFEDKWETLKEYKYHIVIENSSYNDYWTEKLADSYLAESFPFYYGCKNIRKYFSQNSHKIIDIYDIKKSIEIIENGLNNNLYEKYLDEIIKAKQDILFKYNIFPMITGMCDQMDTSKPKVLTMIKHETSYPDLHKAPLLLKRFYHRIKE